MAMIEREVSERAERAYVERVTRSAKYLAVLDAAIERARKPVWVSTRYTTAAEGLTKLRDVLSARRGRAKL